MALKVVYSLGHMFFHLVDNVLWAILNVLCTSLLRNPTGNGLQSGILFGHNVPNVLCPLGSTFAAGVVVVVPVVGSTFAVVFI